MDLGLELEDPLDADQVDAFLLREALDLAQQLDVAQRVAAAAATGAPRRHEAEAVVLAQRLWMHAGHLGRDGDDVERLVIAYEPGRPGHRDDESRTSVHDQPPL